MVALEAVAVILAAATDVASSSAVIIAAAAEVAHTLKVTAGKAFPTADVVVLPADDVAAGGRRVAFSDGQRTSFFHP